MKIGIFGDSYTVRSGISKIWWNYLSENYGHETYCHGEIASSIMFSVKKILKLYDQYDLVIWCLTQSGRKTLNWKGLDVHFALGKDFSNHPDKELRKKWMLFVDWWHSGFIDWNEEEKIIGKALVSYVCNLCKNVMVIPCFEDPLECQFNLYNLSRREIEFYFGSNEASQFYKTYRDLRSGHISSANQIVLGEQINMKLQPGIFQTDLSVFVDPIEPVEKLFQKWQN